MERQIVDPYWGDDNHSQIICKFVYEDGRTLDVSIVNTNGENPDWAAVLEAHSEESITERTDAMLAARAERQKEAQDQSTEQQERAMNEILFNHKIKLFEIQEIQDSTNRELKSKIRKADTIEKATIYATALVTMELSKPATEEITE